MTDTPLDHVERPTLPWRDDGRLTECGKPLGDRKTITREQFIAKLKRQGQARTAMTTCMTCWQTAGRWKPWDESPVVAMRREVTVGYGRDDDIAIRDELLALAALVEAHRDEFDALLAGMKGTVRIEDLRRQRRERDAGGSAS